MKRNADGNLPTCPFIHPPLPADNDERWKAAQVADAKRGKYWGKYGLQLRPKKRRTPMIDKKHYQRALDAQSACNLSGLVFSLTEAMKAICEEGYDTEQKNRHPIVVLYVTQMAYLSGVAPIADTDVYRKAYDTCKEEA
jgi:hypothetical protein